MEASEDVANSLAKRFINLPSSADLKNSSRYRHLVAEKQGKIMTTQNGAPRLLYVFGGHSTALEIADAARASNNSIEIIHVVPPSEATGRSDQLPIEELQEHARGKSLYAGCIVSMVDAAVRDKKLEVAAEANLHPATVVHPSAWVSPSAEIGSGCYVAAGCRISANARIARHCMLNFNVVFGHDSCAEAHFVANPGAVVGGNVTIGKRVLLGANSFILQGTRIGDDCQIDASTYVCRDLEDASMCTSRQLKVYPRRDLKA